MRVFSNVGRTAFPCPYVLNHRIFSRKRSLIYEVQERTLQGCDSFLSSSEGVVPVDPALSLPETLRRLDVLIREWGLKRSDLLKPADLASKAALSESTVRVLLRGGNPPAESVNDRVRSRIQALSQAYMARNGQRMADLAGRISQQLGVSTVWARQVCSGDKTPSVELLHGLADFFRVKGAETFFTVPAPEALNRVLLTILTEQEQLPGGAQTASSSLSGLYAEFSDVRAIALRQARDLPEHQWRVLNATLTALLQDDESEGEQ
ncbi:hypothetical protein [Streptomyces hokutonensis]|uniref:hypothetical protein n=1 Tax=Streptomyces hokutonensis TaxID=1306990 RepID=UPI0037F5FB04